MENDYQMRDGFKGIVEGKGNMERLTYKTNGKYMNTVAEQAPPYAIDCDIDTAITKLAEYEDLEEKGKLLKLPVAVGDIVYRIHKGTKLSPDRVYECKVVGVKQEYNTLSIKLYANINEETYSIWVDDWFDRCQIGHEFFLTEEAAEAALKEMSK